MGINISKRYCEYTFVLISDKIDEGSACHGGREYSLLLPLAIDQVFEDCAYR